MCNRPAFEVDCSDCVECTVCSSYTPLKENEIDGLLVGYFKTCDISNEIINETQLS